MLLTLTYGVTILASSLLLFLVQPIMTKAILPWFGGSAGVWTSAILFFQGALLLGYAYAHFSTRCLSPRLQVWLHAALLAASLSLLPIAASPAFRPDASSQPIPRILSVLAFSVGFPYFLLSATGPLLQRWYVRRDRTAFPYRLFAVSNLGSLAALVLYPFVIEPLIAVRQQLNLWSGAYAAVAALLVFAAFLSAPRSKPDAVADLVGPAAAAPPLPDRLRWLALAACPSALWLGISTELSQNIAPIPLLWVLPLAIYLLSFILTFDREGWYRPGIFRIILPLAWILMGFGISRLATVIPLIATIALLCVVLFVCCMFCHGELAARKPDSSQLTTYYLMLSAGGALGGLFVAVAAPLLFDRYLELPVAIVGCILLAVGVLYRVPQRRVARLAVISLLAFVVAVRAGNYTDGDRLRLRNFYGALHITDTGAGPNALRTLLNGAINHGSQFLAPEKARAASTYYGPQSGGALAIRFPRTGPRRVGVIGLGAGTLAAYGERGDVFRFSELNPAVIALAWSEFRYLRDCPCEVSVVSGDGRLALEREPPQGFDVLIVDAFNGDSIPVHLLTREAFAAYMRHLRPDGILAFHVTNRYLDLTPVVKSLAAERQLQASLVVNPENPAANIYAASWVVATGNPRFLADIAPKSQPFPPARSLRRWTDDYSALFQMLR